MERTKRISSQTLAIAILTVLLVASMLMSVTGAWFTSADDDDHAGYQFGSITLGAMNSSIVFTLDETSGDVIMPGDALDVDFDIVNDGTADMWVRFQLVIGGTAGETYFTEANEAPLGWTEVGGWYYRNAVLIGDLDGVANGSEAVSYTFNIPTSIGDVAESTTITVNLVVQAVQVANNGAINGTNVLGYPA